MATQQLTVAERDGEIQVGDLATFHGMFGRTLKVRVLEADPGATYGRSALTVVKLSVTSRTNAAYRAGEYFYTSPLHLTKR